MKTLERLIKNRNTTILGLVQIMSSIGMGMEFGREIFNPVHSAGVLALLLSGLGNLLTADAKNVPVSSEQVEKDV